MFSDKNDPFVQKGVFGSQSISFCITQKSITVLSSVLTAILFKLCENQ